jgi:hypothetical protein
MMMSVVWMDSDVVGGKAQVEDIYAIGDKQTEVMPRASSASAARAWGFSKLGGSS